MTTLAEPPSTLPVASSSTRLRAEMAAVRVMFTWLGVRKSLNLEQKSQAADTFGAEHKFLSAGKKLLDTSHPAFKAVTSVRSRALSYWKGVSLPYPESGIRLIRQHTVESFSQNMHDLKAELEEAVEELEYHYSELRSAARNRLGSLYESGDYPASLRGWFDMAWDFPSVEPPNYLKQLAPQLYEQEAARISAKFDEAVQLAEQAFTDEFSKLVSHLTERLSGADDGKPKVFRDSAIENLESFFQRFRRLNIHSSGQLDQLVDDAQKVVKGIAPSQLRSSDSLRQQVATQLSSVQSVLDGMLVDRPRRNILRRSK